MDGATPVVPQESELMLIFSQTPKHLEPGRQYRHVLDWLFNTPHPNLKFIIDDKAVQEKVEEKIGKKIPCKVEYAYLFPDRESAFLIKQGGVVRGWYFNHESKRIPYPLADAARVWDRVVAVIKTPPPRHMRIAKKAE